MTFWPLRIRGKPKLFVKFLLSYFLILLVPLLIGLYAYEKTVQVVREDAAELNLTVLEQSEETLNRLLTEIRDTMSLLSLDSEMLNVMITADESWSPRSLYQFAQLQRNELSLLATNRLFSELFVYFRRSEAVISKHAIERMGASTITVDGVPFGRWLDGVIAGDRANRYLRLENVSRGREIGNYLAYVSTLPAGNKQRIDGAVIILIEEREIAGLFKRLTAWDGAFARIVDERGETIVAAGGELPADWPAENDEGAFVQLNGRDLFVTSVLSPSSGWTYQAGLPAEAVFTKAEYIKRINWTIAAVALSLGLLIALLFAYRHSKPIAELVDSIREFAGGGSDAGRRASELDVLATAVRGIISDNRRMDVRMREQLPMLQSACFERLLKSGFNSEREMRAYLEQAQLQLGDRVGAAVLQLQLPEYAPQEELAAEKTVLKRLLLQELGEGCYVHDLKSEKLALLFSYAGAAPEEWLNGLAAGLERVQQTMRRERETIVFVGIGQAYDQGGLELWRSYNEATQALDASDPDAPLKPVRYEEVGRQACQYYYPLELEQKLIHTVKAGDTESLARLADHIEAENFGGRPPSARRERQLVLEMQGTLQKLSEQIRWTGDGPDLAAAAAEAVAHAEEGCDFQRVKEALLALGEGVRRQRTMKRESLFERMKAYVAEHYADNSLSLCALAGEFGQTETFVSAFFKSHMGITFSDYLEQLRLGKACELLRDPGLPIREIAERVGYGSDKSFRRAFKRAYGVQPTSFRSGLETAAGPTGL